MVGSECKMRTQVKTKRPKNQRYIRLTDGYRIVSPPAGGRFSRREIEKAVRAVVRDNARKEKTG